MTSRLLTAAVLLLAAPLHAQTTAAARKAIQAAYDRENAATIRKDYRGALANLAPDYVRIDSRGVKRNRQQTAALLPELFLAVKGGIARTRILSLSLKGPRAYVSARTYAVLEIANPRTGKNGKLVVNSTSADEWVRSGSRWLKKRSRALSNKQTLDGKPVS